MHKLQVLFSYTKGQRLVYFFALLCTLLSQVLVAVQPQLLKITIDSVLGSEPLSDVWFGRIIRSLCQYFYGVKELLIMAGFIVCVAMLRATFTFMRKNLANIATEQSIKKLRDQLYSHLQLLPASYHTHANTGELIQRCTSDVEALRLAFQTQILDGISTVFLISYTIYLMSLVNVPMMCVSLAIMPIMLFVGLLFYKKMEKQFKKEAKLEAALATVLQENLSNIRVVKAFTRHQDEIEKFNAHSESYLTQNLKLNHYFSLFWALLDSLAALQLFSVLLYGSLLSYRGSISVGELVAFIAYVSMLLQPVKMLGRTIGSIGKAVVSMERIQTILTEPTEVLFPTGEKPCINGDIVFEQVFFSYPDNKPVLKDLSFSIQDGQTVAIVGPTAAGKSSLLHVLLRLYDYSAGSIRINGRELKTIDKGWLRSQIGLVLQEPFLYAKTIIENLSLAVPQASAEEARHHSRIVALDDEIQNFVAGYQTMVGEKGVSLSGGQKQRLTIARTLLKDSPIIIFDDSLSAVDSKTDVQIRSAIKKENGNKTMLIISHRISTVCEADKIIVIENGTISQTGQHEELIQKDGLYKRLYEIQASIKQS